MILQFKIFITSVVGDEDYTSTDNKENENPQDRSASLDEAGKYNFFSGLSFDNF